tara:strand:+ start:127 stop:969 length:843 start_codon:yes stop_codon:yes gene_type:complete
MSITLHPHRGKNRWCGPGAIAILTGVTTDDASRMIRAITGKRSCTGTPTTVLREVLRQCGIESHPHNYLDTQKRPTLNQWVEQGNSQGGTYLVVAGNHFQILTGDLFVDNQVKEPTAFEDLKKGKRRRVEATYRLHCPDGVKVPTHINRKLVCGEKLKLERNKVSTVRRKVNALAKELDVSINTEDWRDLEQLWVYVSDEFEAKYGDPWDDYEGHVRFSWDEVLDMLEEERDRRRNLPEPHPAKRVGRVVGEERNALGDMVEIIHWEWRRLDANGCAIWD